MKQGKIVIARLWSRYAGILPLDEPVIGKINSSEFETICIYLSKRSGIENQFEEKYGMKVHYISNSRSVNFFKATYNLSKILKKTNVDILHCFGFQSATCGYTAAKISKVNSVILQVNPVEMIKNRIGFISSMYLKRYSGILVSGRDDRQKLMNFDSGIDSKKIKIIDTSIDYDKFSANTVLKEQARKMLNLPHDALIFGLVGRLIEDKRNREVIEAFVKVKSKINNAHLVFIGDGSQAEILKKQARASGVGDAIHFIGHRDDIEKCLKAFDIFVSAKVSYDGIPRTLLEAMAAGVPCIGPSDGGIEELFNQGRCGIVVSDFEPEPLAKAMIELATMSHNRVLDIVNAASRLVEANYDHKVAAEKLENIYKDLAANN